MQELRLVASGGRWVVPGIRRLWKEYRAQGGQVAGISYSEFRRRVVNRLKREITIKGVGSDGFRGFF